MEITSQQFVEMLNSLDPTDDEFVLQVDELVENTSDDVMRDAHGDIFRFFEAHPQDDCGMPGTLVHAMEDCFPNYVAALIESMTGMPSVNTVLMINRILNSDDTEFDLRSRLINSLRDAIDNERCLPEIHDDAQRYLDRHQPNVEQWHACEAGLARAFELDDLSFRLGDRHRYPA